MESDVVRTAWHLKDGTSGLPPSLMEAPDGISDPGYFQSERIPIRVNCFGGSARAIRDPRVSTAWVVILDMASPAIVIWRIQKLQVVRRIGSSPDGNSEARDRDFLRQSESTPHLPSRNRESPVP